MSTTRKQAMRHVNWGFSAGGVITLLLFVLAMAGVVWVYNGTIAQERWPIRWLDVDGPFERVSAEQVRASLAPLVNGSFFTVDTKVMREITSAMPWVASVSVQKTWPDTVQVTIHEHTPVVHWVDDFLLDAQGQPFNVPSANEIQGLPWLESPQGQMELVFENWKKFDDKLEAIGQQVERLTLDPRGSWSARLSGGTEVKLGKGDIFKNLDMLVSTWAGLMQGQATPPVSVDLRYTNGFAVLWPQNIDIIAEAYGKKS
ncbi:MAG: FtsQ-type POTRA domain-containing protein [Lysobacterales bacterium]